MARQVGVYEMNDCDWVAARTIKEARECYETLYGADSDEPPRRLTPKEMNKCRFHLDDSHEGHEFPDFFASTEF